MAKPASNLLEINISAAKDMTRKIIDRTLTYAKAGKKLKHSPIYLHSSPGLGKSSIIKQIAEEMKIGFVDKRLAQMEQSDVAGIPYVSHAGDSTEKMKMSVPTWFPSVEKIADGECPEYGILFLDELSNAPISVQHSAYSIILDREVHGVKMGEGWQIIAAGNKKDDKTGAKGVAPALANRFGTHIFIRPDFGDFYGYALGAGIHKEVLGFLQFKQDALYSFDPSKNDVSFATPRSWEQASELLDMGFDKTQLAIALTGCVGKGLANDFLGFRQHYSKLPNFNDIMDGKMDYKVPKDDMGLIFAISSTVITAMIENSDNKKRVQNLSKVMVQLGDDFLTLIYKSLQRASEHIDVSNVILNTKEAFTRVTKHLNSTD